ncbi:MAG TPA: PqqD family protein [Thermodesulfobacteriota bacterium]|nr:PqqD family protein [Thermodesulfobacteriota bacterium]
MSEYPKIAEGIDINQVEDGYVIYQSDKDKVHYLNKTAVLVLEACTGKNTPADITSIVKDAYGLDAAPEKEVADCLNTLIEEGLVK